MQICKLQSAEQNTTLEICLESNLIPIFPVPCRKGTYRIEHMKVCTRCEGNTIQPGKGKTFCRDCPAGTVANKNKNQCGMCLCEVFRLVLSHQCNCACKGLGNYFQAFLNRSLSVISVSLIICPSTCSKLLSK